MSRTDSSDSRRATWAVAIELLGENLDFLPFQDRSPRGDAIRTDLVVDPTTPIVARRFPLAAAILSAHAHEGTAIGAYAATDANRIDAWRARFAIPAAVQSAMEEVQAHDGTGPSARFDAPTGVAVDGAGNVFVANQADNAIRKISHLAIRARMAGRVRAQPWFDGFALVAFPQLLHHRLPMTTDLDIVLSDDELDRLDDRSGTSM
jgi:DNA-binding beta-propeller fold protein YncE